MLMDTRYRTRLQLHSQHQAAAAAARKPKPVYATVSSHIVNMRAPVSGPCASSLIDMVSRARSSQHLKQLRRDKKRYCTRKHTHANTASARRTH